MSRYTIWFSNFLWLLIILNFKSVLYKSYVARSLHHETPHLFSKTFKIKQGTTRNLVFRMTRQLQLPSFPLVTSPHFSCRNRKMTFQLFFLRYKLATFLIYILSSAPEQQAIIHLRGLYIDHGVIDHWPLT